MTEQTTATTEVVSKVTAGKNAVRVVQNIQTMFPYVDILKYAVVAKGDVYDVLEYIVTGTLTQEVAKRIVDAAYGTDGKPSKRVKQANKEIVSTISMPVITALVDEAFKAIPKEELAKEESSNVTTKTKDSIKRMLASGLEPKVVASYMASFGVKLEDVEALLSEE